MSRIWERCLDAATVKRRMASATGRAAALVGSPCRWPRMRSSVATFDWMPTSENPSAGASPALATGTLQMTLSSFGQTTGTNPTNSPDDSGLLRQQDCAASSRYHRQLPTRTPAASPSAWRIGRATRFRPSIWETSALDTCGDGRGRALTCDEWLLPGSARFTLSGFYPRLRAPAFKIANAAGTPGATFTTGISNGDNTFRSEQHSRGHHRRPATGNS